MEKYLVSEEEVKKVLNINDFRSISKEKIMEFISLIPRTDKEILISIINQFPNYVDMAKNMTDGLIGLCDTAIKEISNGSKEVIESYKIILISLKDRLEKDELSYEQKNEITEMMVQIADKISLENSKKSELINNYMKYGSKIVGGLLFLGAVILGVNIKDAKFPNTKK